MSANSRAIQYTLAATIMSTGASAMAENIANLKATGKERVAALIPQTGPLAPVGKDIRHGTSLALEYLKNEKGITLEISFLDSGNTPDDAKKVTNQAILDGTTLFINCFGGVACMEIAKNSKSFPLINPMTGAMLLRDSEKFPNVYPLVNGARWELDALVKQAKNQGFKEMVAYVQQDGFGKSYEAFLWDVLKKYDIKLKATIEVPPPGPNTASMDFKTLTGPSRGGTNSLLLVSGPNAIKLATAISEDPQKGFNVVSNLGGQATKGFIDGMKGKSVGHAIVNLVPHPDSGQESYGSIYSKLAGTEATFAGFSGFLWVMSYVSIFNKKVARPNTLWTDGIFPANTFTLERDGRIRK